jgi:predicted O-methyltransferase YrrM
MLDWVDDESFRIGDVEFVCRPVFRRFPSTSSRFCLLKARWSVEGYQRLCRDLSPRRIVEVGVYDGGSTAFLAEVTGAEKLLAVDVNPPRSGALHDWIRQRGFERRVVPQFEVDQSDVDTLSRLVEREFDAAPLDLVIDDASHEPAPTRATFDCLFPQLAPGGVYVIEDWLLPLTPVVVDLMIVAAQHPEVVAEVRVWRTWATIVRGPADLDADTFTLSALVGHSDRARDLGLEGR